MKKMISLLLSASLCLSMGSVALAAEGDFTDVKETDYYSSAVQWAVDNNVTTGVSDDRFGASDVVTRSQVVTFLWRMAGSPTGAAKAGFDDVADDAWYAQAVNWAAANHIANGIDDNTFSPEGICTREQVAAFLYRFEQLQGKGFNGLWAVSLDYSDNGQISPWAYESLSWMDVNGVMGGYDGAMDPWGQCDRGQLITMLYRTAQDKTPLETQADTGYTEKEVPVLRETLDTDETVALRFYNDLPNVPYMTVNDFYNRFYLMGTQRTEGMTTERNEDGAYVCTNFGGNSATFDTEADTIYTENLLDFVTCAYGVELKLNGAVDENYPFIEYTDERTPNQPIPQTLDLKPYGIDLRSDGEQLYVPLSTLCDLFATVDNVYVVYSGAKLYTRDYSGNLQDGSAMDEDPDYYEDLQSHRPVDLAQFNYRELCFCLDLWYGQPGQEWIHEDLKTAKFDQILTEKYPQIKQMLLAPDFLSFYTGLNHLFYGIIFDGGHTSVSSDFVFDNLDLTLSVLRPLWELDYGKANYDFNISGIQTLQREEARADLYGEDFYAEKGDTAIIYFDRFEVDSKAWKDFYAGKGDRPLEGDTVGTVLTGLERAAQNPEIKNIVIDISCNGGGYTEAMMSLEWLMTGTGYIRDEDQFSQQIKDQGAMFDMNFDGQFDERDVSPFTGYRYGVLTSHGSFSCGNAFPWFMHEHGAMILGQQSGGGACAIRTGVVNGLETRLSAATNRIINDQGGSVDFGCPVDVDLVTEDENPYVNFYDLSLLSELMNQFFDGGQEAAA